MLYQKCQILAFYVWMCFFIKAFFDFLTPPLLTRSTVTAHVLLSRFEKDEACIEISIRKSSLVLFYKVYQK